MHLRGIQRTVRGSRVATPLVFGVKKKSTEGNEVDSSPASFDKSKGNCAERDPDEMFTQGVAQNITKKICSGCPIKTECLADALDHRIEFGVWGGMTERERRALLRRHPQVTSWRKLFNRAKDQSNVA